MQKYIVTGFSGFVSKHFIEYLDTLPGNSFVVGIDINEPVFEYNKFKRVECTFYKIDLLDKNKVDTIIFDFQPHFILHLASFSSVAYSWKNPTASFNNNTNIFLNLLEQVRLLNLKCRILSVGSSEEYGNLAGMEMPLKEEYELKPISPYAVARVSQELLSKVYVEGYGLDIVLTRSFNHIGPGQRDVFVVSSFAKQLTEIERKSKTAEIITGNLNIIRDFLDVRDVVRAYHELFFKGRKGEVYNICSGKGISLLSIINSMASFMNIKITTKTDPLLIRPNDNFVIIGSNEKIRRETTWEISYNLEDSLKDILEYWGSNI